MYDCEDEHSLGIENASNLLEEWPPIRNVIEHEMAEDEVKRAVVERERPREVCMSEGHEVPKSVPGRPERGFAHVDTGYICAVIQKPTDVIAATAPSNQHPQPPDIGDD